MGATANILLQLTAKLTAALDLKTALADLSYKKELAFANGAGAGQIEDIWDDVRTLTTGASEDLDFSGATLVNAFGVALAFTGIKAIVFESDPTNTVDITIGNTTATQFLGPLGAATHTYILKPGDIWLAYRPSAAGYPVAAGSTDLFKVLAGAATVIYKVIVLGKKS